MSLRIVGAAAVDRRGLIGGSRAPIPLDPCGRLRWRTLSESPFPTFRRLDRLSKLACLAAEAAGVGALPEGLRRETALVLGTVYGCLEADLQFAASLAEERELRPALFPYTLPSTCLGELAVRYGLQGPSLCLSEAAGQDWTALSEAQALLSEGEAQAACVCLGDVLPAELGAVIGGDPPATFVALILASHGPAVPGLDLSTLRGPAVPAAVADRLWETQSQ